MAMDESISERLGIRREDAKELMIDARRMQQTPEMFDDSASIGRTLPLFAAKPCRRISCPPERRVLSQPCMLRHRAGTFIDVARTGKLQRVDADPPEGCTA